MTDRQTGDGLEPARTESGPEVLQSIRDLAAAQAAELEGLRTVLDQLRLAVGEPSVTIDADAVWQRVLARLDRGATSGDAGPIGT